MPAIDAICELVAHARARGLALLAVETSGFRFRAEFAQEAHAPGTATGAPPPSHSPRLVTTPGFGAFVAAPPSADAPFVAPGDRVRAGDILGLLQIGPVYRAIRSPVAGRIRRVLARPGELLGYGAAAFEIEPNGPEA